jgi:replicative DNA helicase
MDKYQGVDGEYSTMNDLILKNYQVLEKQFNSQPEEPRIKTGFHELDKITLGMEKGDMVIVASSPDIERKSFMINMASYSATCESSPTNVLVFSMGRRPEDLSMEILSSMAKLDFKKPIKVEEWKFIANASIDLADSNFYIDHTPDISLNYIISHTLDLKKHKNIDMIVIDSLHKIHGFDPFDKDALLRLKKFASNSGILFVIGVSLKDFENRPTLNDLDEVVNNARDYTDQIIFLHKDNSNKHFGVEGLTEVTIANFKERPYISFKLTFDKHTHRFINYGDSDIHLASSTTKVRISE